MRRLRGQTDSGILRKKDKGGNALLNKKWLAFLLATALCLPTLSMAQTVTGMGGLVMSQEENREIVAEETPSPLVDVPVAQTQTEGGTSNTEAVAAFLESEGFDYRQQNYENISEDFYATISTNTTLGDVEMRIDTYTDYIALSIPFPLVVPQERRSAMAEFLSLVNYDLLMGSFQMNHENGDLFFYDGVSVYGNVPPEIISDMVWYAVDYLDTYGDALAKIILTDVDPQEAYEAL